MGPSQCDTTLKSPPLALEGNFSQVYVNHNVELFSAMKFYDTVAVDSFRRKAEDYYIMGEWVVGRGGGGHSLKFLVGLCGLNLETLFHAKICDFYTLFKT